MPGDGIIGAGEAGSAACEPPPFGFGKGEDCCAGADAAAGADGAFTGGNGD
jgi:hypothetical protein